MGKVAEFLFPNLVADRDKWVDEAINRGRQIVNLEDQLSNLSARYESLADELTTKTLECASLQARLTALQPAPLEPKIIKASTAADVRRLVEQENLREQAMKEQEAV